MNSHRQPSNKIKKLFFLILFSIVALTYSICFAAPRSDYTVYVEGLRSNNGVVRVSLYNDEASYKTRSKEASFRIGILPVRNGHAVWHLTDVPSGYYALLFYHDENNNNVFDKNFIGIPTEGWGFSGNVTSKTNVPSFSEAMFPFDPQHRSVTVHMQYW